MGNENHAGRTLQQERVLLLRDDIIALMKLGLAMPIIQKRIGLEDMPRSTFYYHAARLRDAAGIDIYAPTGVSDTQATRPPSPVPAKALQEKAEHPPEPAAGPQPQHADTSEPDGDAPKKPARRKIRRGFVVPESRDAKDLDLDPSKWKKSE